ncbi:MAG: alcohol dehydrogenase catalytic domain-containing protein [Spirochaetales bacterium]|nr:alcohol dehydrogenase catalytic domain-containing protein [Spirochaetales bacterium]MCF7937955.1 alcohol dehydrogenase catalytic domain-containing protein [Spirochaetales bacterium]
MATMKAHVFYEKEKMQLEDVPVPEISDIEVLVKVKKVGICGSDISYYYGLSPVDTPTGKGPLTLGHEFTGVVEKVGSVPASMGLYKEGDRVVVNPVQNCNACYMCADGKPHLCQNMSVLGVSVPGAFAEYVASKYTGLFKLPDNISFEGGALTEPMACALNGMRRLEIEPGNFVTVFGPGPMGMMMVQMARAMGAGKVALVGTRDYRLEWGKKFGVDYFFNVKDQKSPYYTGNLKDSISEVTGGKLSDRVIVPTGSNAAFEQGVDIGGEMSIIVQFGLPNEEDKFSIPALEFHTMDKQIRSAWLAPLAWPETIRLIQEGLVDVDSLVSHTYPLEKTDQAIKDLTNRVGDPMKVVISTD